MFEKGKVYASGSNKSSDRVGIFQKGKVYEGGGGNLYDMSQLIDKTVTNPTEAFRQSAGGNPIPHVNPTKPVKNNPVSGELTLTDKLNIGNISEKLRAGIDLNKTERETVSRVGLDSVMSGKADGTFDLNAADSPNNRARLSRVKAIIAKQKAGKEITENENDTLETFKLLNNYKKMSASENSVMTGDFNENARKMNEGLAGKLYNDTAYGNKHFKVGSKEFTVNEKDVAQVALGNIQQTKNRIKLYANTGAEQYVKGIDTTIGVLTGKSPKEIAAEPDSAYAMASALLKEHFAQRGDKFSSAVQDVVTNMANNAPAMIIGSAAGLAGLPAAAASAVGTSSFAVTVFGNAYKEAVQLGATDNQGKLIAYALADTALECGLEYLIGGIPGVGGVLSGDLISDISKQFSDVFMKAIVKTVGNGAGEFVEEGTQTILAPLLQKWLLGADVETVADNPLEQLSQAAYDGFIGFMSSVFMGAGTQLQGAAVEQNIQEYGKRYKSEMGQSNADIKEIARYFAEVSEKNSDLCKAAEAVAKGDTSDFSVGNMMSLGINYSKNSTEQIYRKVGESVRNSEGGISGLLESYKLLTENGLIFPEKTEGLYSDISATLESGFEVSDEMLGEFAMQVQTYSPRAVMMRELTKEAEAKADTETQPAVKESVFDEVSAQKPEYDLIEDWAYTSKGKTRLTDEQKKIAKIGKALGWNVEFDAVHIKDKNGKIIRSENGVPRRADGSIDIKNKRITIDYENKQPIQFIFKHELTHFGESSKLYGDFTEAVEKSKLFEKWLGEKTGKQGSAVRLKAQLLNDIMSTRTNAGAAVDTSGARAEMIADFVGDALFSDNGSGLESIIKNADTKERGAIRQFLHDFISYLKKKISGNREISFEISRLEDMFNRMFTDATEKTSDNQTEKYSIVALENGNTYVKASRNVISGDNISAWRKQITNFFNELLDGEKSLDISTIDGDVLTITKSETANKARDNFKQVNGQKVRMSADEFRVKLNAEAHIDEIAETSIGVKNKTADTKSHDFASNGFTYRTAYFQDFDGTYYRLRLSVGNNGTVATVYNVGKINKDSLPSHTKIVALVGSKPLGKLSDNSISNNNTSVNTYSTQEEGKNTADNQTEKYSLAGERARTSNKSLLEIAKQRIENGEDSETIRQETGWFKGYDGKWRFEISDFESHLIENPKLERHEADGEIYFTGKLSDILEHKELFKAYPELKDINIIIQPTAAGVQGVYQKKSNYITLDINLFKRHTKEYGDYLNGGRKTEIERIEQTPEYKEYSKYHDDTAFENLDPEIWLKEEKAAREKFFNSELGKRYYELNWGKNGFTGQKFEIGWNNGAEAVLMHELQHAIQGIEGFAGGSNPKHWSLETKNAEVEYNKKQAEYEKRLDGFADVLYRYGYTDYDFEKSDITTESGIEEAKRFLKKAEAPNGAIELADNLKQYAKERDEAFSYYWRLKKGNPSELYKATAGEIEARDVEKRLNYTAEQRKNTRPDIDRKDVVFADGGVSYSIAYTTDNKPVAVIDEDILDGVPKSQWIQTVKDTISSKFSDGIPISGRLIKVNSISRSEFTNSKYSKYLKSSDGTVYRDKFKSANNLDDIILASTNYINEDLKHSRNDKFIEFARGDVLIRTGNTDYSAKVIVGFTSGKQMVLYDVINFVPTSLDIKNKDNSIDFGKNRNLRNELSSDTTVPQNEQSVNTYSTQEEGKNTADNQTEKYSIAYTTDNKPVAVIDEDILDGVPKSQWIQTVKDTISSKFSDGIPISGRLIKVNQKTRNEFTNSRNSRWYADNNQVIYADKFKSANNLDDIILASTNYINEDLKHSRNDKFIEFARGDVLIKVGDTDYSAKVIVGFTSGKQMVLYDVIDFSQTSFEIKKTDVRSPSSRVNAENGSNTSVSNTTVPQKEQSVNTNISENTQNDTEKYSIETESNDRTEDFDKIADLVNRYNNGEISKNEYYEQMREEWQKAGKKYGTIPEGENAAEDYGVPNATKEGAPTRRYVRTVLETGSLTDSMKDQIGAEILQGNFSYSPISDESSIKSADKAIESGEAEKRWKTAIESKNISKKTIAIGERLLADAIKAKDNARVLELSAELSDVLTRAGQVVQSARLLKQMTGVGRLVALQRTVQTLNTDLAKRFGDKAPVIQIDENVAQIMAESQTEEEIEGAYRETVQDIADQVPATFLDKWNAWRYFAMLANPRTHIRNIVGNTIFIPAVRTKDVIATGIERIAQLGNSEVERTKVVAVKKEYREFAKNDANSKEVKALLKDQKYDERSQLYKMRRTFKNNALEFLTSFNGNLLEAEDLLFKNRHYIHALGSFLQARNADLNDVSESLMLEARSYAVKEAQKATFNDESAIANYLKSITQIKGSDATALKVAKIAVDGVIPFKRTPVNIIRRGIEYSPIGLGKALTAGLYDVKKGKISISEFADGLAAGLTGTGIFAVGMLLSKLGYVNGGFGDDDEDKFKKLNGEQEYSVQVFGKSYTIDWAAPACIPFFIGVETANSFKDDGGVKLSDFTGALWNALEPVTNLSMLSGIQNTISAAKYSSASETLASIGEDIALSYAMQGIPSLAGSISRTIDPTQRSWYTDKNSSISKFGQEAINNIESKIPGVSYFQAPSIDQWGRIKNRGRLAERLTENFLSPGYYSDIEYDDVNSELKRIIEKTGDTKVVPKKAPTSFNVNKKQKFLTAKEYTTFATAKGQMSFDYVKEFIETPAYKKLTDEQRIEVISGLYEYAGAKAKTTVSDYDLMKSYKTVTNLEKNGTSAVYYYISRALK